MIAPKVVAVVDDEWAMRKAVVRLLSASGFATRDYASAEAFLDCPAACESACLVLDVNLGGISGIELRRQLTRAGSHLPVIFITGIDHLATQREAMEAGCIGYLPKPFAGNVLIGMIAKAIE
jgi:FixJ family two-component response regulator